MACICYTKLKLTNVTKILTHTAEKHGEVHDPDGPPPTSVIVILGVITTQETTSDTRQKINCHV